MPKSKKELRHEAALRERERRAECSAQENLANAEAADWGTAQILTESLRRNILRLGGMPASPKSNDALVILTREIAWPSRSYSSSEIRYRNQSAIEIDDLEIQDTAWPWCRDFRFCNGEFYPNWQDDFTACDSNYAPIGADGHYYYLISRNQSVVTNPLVYRVDQETVDETPYNQDDATIGTLLELLIAT